MTNGQVVSIAIGISVMLYLLFGTHVGETRRVLTVKFNDNLKEYVTKDRDEYNNIMLKDKHDILYFDGEYFFDEAPTELTKKVSQVKVVKDEEKLFNGQMSSGDRSWYIFLTVICTLILLGVFSENTGGVDDEGYF